MLLAYEYRHKDIVLAFVNYNVRNDTNIDEQIVTSFANKYNLTLEKLILDGNYPNNENFENWARNIRYSFFKKIYDKYQCNELLIAHHKDDFLESCVIQEKNNKNKLFYGIKQRIVLNKMKINRPFLLKYWKNEIYDLAKKFNLNYNDDYTNLDNSFLRNKIRNIDLKKYSLIEKELLLKKFLKINEQNKSKINLINKEYYLWRKSKFDSKIFSNLNYKDELIKIFINKRLNNINLSKNIINNIISFIEAQSNGKKYLLSGKNYILKKNNKLYINIIK